MSGRQSEPRDTTMPVDPDLPVGRPFIRRGWLGLRRRADILLVIGVGGALGSAARYGVAQLVPHRAGQLPWATVSVNVLGCLLIGMLMVFVMDVWPPQRYVRPFLGVGVLGGFTTFSTYTVDTWQLAKAGVPWNAVLYLIGSLGVGLVAVWVGLVLARLLVRTGHRRKEKRRSSSGSRQERILDQRSRSSR